MSDNSITIDSWITIYSALRASYQIIADDAMSCSVFSAGHVLYVYTGGSMSTTAGLEPWISKRRVKQA